MDIFFSSCFRLFAAIFFVFEEKPFDGTQGDKNKKGFPLPSGLG
jgi:hypothetical protein